jgi:hypothetical protein
MPFYTQFNGSCLDKEGKRDRDRQTKHERVSVLVCVSEESAIVAQTIWLLPLVSVSPLSAVLCTSTSTNTRGMAIGRCVLEAKSREASPLASLGLGSDLGSGLWQVCVAVAPVV